MFNIMRKIYNIFYEYIEGTKKTLARSLLGQKYDMCIQASLLLIYLHNRMDLILIYFKSMQQVHKPMFPATLYQVLDCRVRLVTIYTTYNQRAGPGLQTIIQTLTTMLCQHKLFIWTPSFSNYAKMEILLFRSPTPLYHQIEKSNCL